MEIASLLLAFGLVLANGFFVAVEFALVKVRPTQLAALAEEKRPGAKLALTMRQNLDAWLSASQVGITLASLGLGWVGEPAFARLIEPAVVSLVPSGGPVEAVAHTVGVVLAFATITFLHIVVGEQVPKMMAIARAEQTAMVLAWPMRLFYFMAWPVIRVLNLGTNGLLRLLGLEKRDSEAGETLGEDELRLVLASSAESGALQKNQAELLERALSMMQKTARQVLVPRSQMRFVDLDATLEENLAAVHQAGHTWMPVIRGSLDQVEGLINVKDLYYLASRGELKSIAQVQRPVLFVPENVTLEQLLAEFKRRNKQMAVVVDEHGGTSGLVSLADVVAELVGHVAELGRKVEPVRTLPGGRIELPGTAQLDDLEHTLELEFDVDKTQITTIAGYLMAKLGRVPVTGDAWTLGDFRICATRTEGPRVLAVRIEPAPVTPPIPPPRPSAPAGS